MMGKFREISLIALLTPNTMSSCYLEIEPLTVSVGVEVRPQVELVVGVRDPDGLLQVAGLEPTHNPPHETHHTTLL